MKLPEKHIRFGKSIQDNSWQDSVEQSIGSIVPTGPYANDAAAAAAGVPLTGFYYTSAGVLHIRLV